MDAVCVSPRFSMCGANQRSKGPERCGFDALEVRTGDYASHQEPFEREYREMYLAFFFIASSNGTVIVKSKRKNEPFDLSLPWRR